ncbi:MAG: MotA/TolQ/ExbB proton channel family protein [Candidatus Binatia bacterium]
MRRSIILTISTTLAITLGLIFRPEFFDPVSLLITLGGALAVTWLSYSKAQLAGLWHALHDLCAGAVRLTGDHTRELQRLTELYRLQGIRGLENQERHLDDGDLKFAVGLLVDLHKEEKIRLCLEHRLAAFVAENESNREILATLGKLLPSLGLIGTLIGMVLLLGNIASVDAKQLPAALSLAVLTTLYGALFANVVVAPVAGRLQSAAMQKEVNLLLTKDWILLVVRGDASALDNSLTPLTTAGDGGAARFHDWQPLRLTAQ